MVESKSMGKIVRFVLKVVFILGGWALIISPMTRMIGASLEQIGSVIAGSVSTVVGLMVASQAGMLARALVKIKAPSLVLTGIVVAAVIAGYIVGCALGHLLLNFSIVVSVIAVILILLASIYFTAQTGVLLSMAVGGFLPDKEREILRRNVKMGNIPAEYRTPKGERVLDEILFSQGLVSSFHIRMSDNNE